MSVRQWMVAGVLAMAGIGSAVATDLDTHDTAMGSRGAAESSARDTGGAVGGDLLGISREAAPSRRGSDTESDGGGGSRSGSAAGGSEHGGRISAPTSAREAPLGWQSLLPGSIQ